MTKKEILNARTVAYYSGYDGLEIKDILYGLDDYVAYTSSAWTYTSGAWIGKKRAHICKIYYTASGNAYFKYNGIRIPLNECIRI